ncbi:unnamed protein product [Musa textilis]
MRLGSPRRVLFSRLLCTLPPKLKNVCYRHRARALVEAQRVLTDYLHGTRGLPFFHADYIASHSPLRVRRPGPLTPGRRRCRPQMRPHPFPPLPPRQRVRVLLREHRPPGLLLRRRLLVPRHLPFRRRPSSRRRLHPHPLWLPLDQARPPLRREVLHLLIRPQLPRRPAARPCGPRLPPGLRRWHLPRVPHRADC